MNDLFILPTSWIFRWREREFKLGASGKRDGQAFAEVTPHDDELVEEIKRRIVRDNGLTLYIGMGYVRFADEA